MKLGYDLYGWRIASDVPLPGPLIPRGEVMDLEVSRGVPETAPDELPEGEPVAELVTNGRRWYGASRSHDGRYHRLRFTDIMHADLDLERRMVRCSVDPAAPDGIERVLLGGTCAAYALSVTGHAVLHASAVEIDGIAIAFVGPSGAGKSTIAALTCAGGASLVTDDVLRVDVDAAVSCWRGADTLRIREKTASVCGILPSTTRGPSTPDGRISLRPAHTEHRQLPLAAVVFAQPDRASATVDVTPLSQADATVSLASAPRILGWLRPDDLRREFGNHGAIARNVPAFVASVPWAGPFRSATGDELLGRILGALQPMAVGA